MCRKKPGPVRRKVRKYIAILLSLLILFTVYFEIAVKHQLRDIIIRDMQTLSEQAVTMAVDDLLAEYSGREVKTCDITYDNGSVAAITTDASYINSVKTFITTRAQERIDALSRQQGVSIRLGNFSGLVFLSDIGPDIPFSVDSSQTVSCEFRSSFESAGVNQTVHHITITVYVDLLIYSPFRVDETVGTESTFEIAQTVIVGTVPSYSGVVSY
ncbi:MAG: sporulation protein YunB [Ruminococcus sp.]|uniref:sporulation protein YunB n=1 Tax=Ruminococcus sp. TaxID=41978 RepID=UPI002872CDE5|nr:sporulation protein YunB [Ruminococcus sp.]MBQ3284969.1 sporulation protein YunB [Ruminococcus sp.]